MHPTSLITHSAALSLALVLGAACGSDPAPSRDTIADTRADTDTAAPDTTPPDTALETVDFDTSPPADTNPDTSPDSADGEGCTGFACPCQGNGDCDSGVCLEGPDGLLCSRSCLSECPDDFDCLRVAGVGPDGQSVCVPRHARLCRPCRTNDDCASPSDPYPAFCLPVPTPAPPGSSGSFCGSSCAARPCPSGYTCEDVTVSGAGMVKQCVPSDGTCECRDAWQGLGLFTECGVRNVFGTCPGTRTCGESGLGACVGEQASPEVCDGVDNDCDGQTDNLPTTPCFRSNVHGSCEGRLTCSGDTPVCDGPEPLPESCNGLDEDCDGLTDESTCDDGLACTDDRCAQPLVCAHDLRQGFCLIGGACLADGQFNPLNPCERCDVSRSTDTWSRAANTCLINGACYPALAVNPNNACQICSPAQSNSQWSPANNTCQIAGRCYGANQANPDNACQICSPVQSTTTWTQALNTCNIQGQCVAAGVTRPGVPCQLCDPLRSSVGWSNAGTQVSCDDGNACSVQSFCNGAGACVGETSCDDGIACTEDICFAQTGCSNTGIVPGFCRINNVCYAQNTANPANPCERCNPAVSVTSWAPQPSNVGCSDGQYCTVNDRCNGAGQCVGEPRSCSDGLTCTADTCAEGADECVQTLEPGQCQIAGTCYAAGQTQPNNTCYVCSPAHGGSSWSLNNGTSCNDGDNCTTNDRCSGGTCIGQPLKDVFENNDTIGAAYNLGNFTDAQSFPQRTVSNATMLPEGDVDWFVYFVDDVWNGAIEPRVRVSGIAPTFALESCVYFRCTAADALPSKLDCARVGATASGTVTYQGKEHRGCCRTGPNVINIELSTSEFDCAGEFDDFQALIRIRNTSNSWTCNAPYTIELGNDGTNLP